MWRVPVSIVLAGVLGSAFGTIVYMVWLWVSEIGTGPFLDPIWLVAFMDASFFTVPGAILLAMVEMALWGRVDSVRAIDGVLLAFGALAGAAILGGLGGTEALLATALAGGIYGLSTATIFVFFQHQLRVRQALDL